MENNDSKQKGIIALTMWLQTFPSFGPKICDNEKTVDAHELFGVIETSRLTKIVRQIASEVCGIEQASDENDKGELSEDRIIKIWGSLYSVTSRLARPISDENHSVETMSPSELKLYILSNLLDISVNHPNLEMRRSYIGRILKLSKHVQKRLMAMIELRVKRQKETTTESGTPSRVSKTPPKYSTPERKNSSTTPLSSDRQRTPERGTGSSNSSSFRGHSPAVYDDTGTGGYAPTTKRQSTRSPDCGFLSPGTMDSPQAIRSVVQSLQQKNKELSHDLALAQRRELEFKTKMDTLKQNHRQDMIRLESASMEREQDLKRDLEGQIKEMEKKVSMLTEESEKGKKAQEELTQARDELDVVNRHQNELHEMAERLRKYKDKVAEYHDLKEALKREQEAHSRSVEEIVKLESEVKVLQPAKRQLEEYKIRAIEAEVKLVESQDNLRRLEQQAQQATDASDSLFKETKMQKEHMDELVKRINAETQASIENPSESLAEGVSELNPEIQQELVRLRNENLQLRAFAAKRQDDAVEVLESRLDDAERLGTKFKEQFLETKENLGSTQNELQESKAREDELKAQVQTCEREMQEIQTEVEDLQGKKAALLENIESMKRENESLDKENGVLRNEIQSLQIKLKETFELGTERLEQLRKVTEELTQVNKKLSMEQVRSGKLEEATEAWKANAKEVKKHFEEAQDEIDEIKSQVEELTQVRDKKQEEIDALNHNSKTLEESKAQLLKQMEDERRSHNMSLHTLEEQFEEERESNKSALEATKEILERKYKQELEEQSEQLSNMLETEKNAARNKEDSNKIELERVIEEKNKLREDYESKLSLSKMELADTIMKMKEESQSDIEAATKSVRKECEANTNEIIKKGRDMINDTKSVLKQEIENIDKENRNLREELDENRQAFDDLKRAAESTEEELHKRLEQSLVQINSLTTDVDETQERLVLLQRELRRVQDENDLYRRQAGGRFGADGKLQAQFENLQREYNALLEENRQMKHQYRHSMHGTMGDIAEGGSIGGGYNTRAQSRNTVGQVRREYEEAMSVLSDEKRELLMKHSAAVADVEKAEKRAWEREQENEKLRAEMTSLKLALERVELSSEGRHDIPGTMQSPNHSVSFFSAQEEEEDRQRSASGAHSPPRSKLSGHGTYKNSPSIERAKRERAHLEQSFRNSLSNFRSWSDSPSKALSHDDDMGVPPPPTSPRSRFSNGGSTLDSPDRRTEQLSVLSPSKKHEHVSNLKPPASTSREATSSGNLNRSFNDGPVLLAKSPSRSSAQGEVNSAQQPITMIDYMNRDKAAIASGDDNEGQPECQQS